MSRWKQTIWICVALLLSLALPQALVHGAQVLQLDQGTLINTLAREGMSKLLDHLAKTDSGKDPVISKLIEIGQLRVRFNHANLAQKERTAAFQQLVVAKRSLIQTYPDHYQRPLWQTDLAETLLYDGLQNVYQFAGEYYEFGVLTEDQRHGFKLLVAEAFEHLVAAEIRLFHLKIELPRQEDHVAKRVETGWWDRMINEYDKTKTPLMLALSAYYTSLLPDDHDYFQNLKNPNIPRQEATPNEERSRLRALSIDRLASLNAAANDPFQVKRTAQCLAGRVMLHQKQYGEAIELLDQVIGGEQQDLNDLLAHLAKAVVLHQQNHIDDSQKILESLSEFPLVKANLLYRLLVVDQQHRLKLVAAKSRKVPEIRRAEIAKAYEPYELLMSSPVLNSQDREGLKNYIYARWESMIKPGVNLAGLPDSVLAAAGEIARKVGQALVFQAEKFEADGHDERVTQLLGEARPKLERAVTINKELLKRQALLPRVRATGMFNLAMSNYLLAQGDMGKLTIAAGQWTDLAQLMPEQPVSEQAITSAIAVLHQLHELTPRPAEVAKAYERTATILFERFSTIEAADNERVYYAFYVLDPRGEYTQAARLLSKIPRNHLLYFEAQREMLNSLKKVFDNAKKGPDRVAARKNVSENARRVIQEAQNEPEANDPQRFKDARQAHGWARLILADLAIIQNQIDQAQLLLDHFEDEFKDEPDLVRLAMAKGIVMLAQAGDLGQLVIRAKTMMTMFPDDAAAVIDEVLSDVTVRIDQLRTDAQQSQVKREKMHMVEQATSLAQAAQMLAELLLDWGVRQNLNQADLVPFKLRLAKAMRLAGRPEAAIAILEPLLEQNPNDMDLIFEMAETLFAIGVKTGDRALLIRSAEYYDRLIGGIGQPFPLIWWRAWLGRLKIMDRLGESVTDIPLRVRALELVDVNLGGEPFKSEFKQLQVKHTK